MRKLFQYGGYLSSAVLILFGGGAVVIGLLGLSEVRDAIAGESITATDDAAEIGVNLEPGEAIDTGAEAKDRQDHQDARARGHRWADLRRDGAVPHGER